MNYISRLDDIDKAFSSFTRPLIINVTDTNLSNYVTSRFYQKAN